MGKAEFYVENNSMDIVSSMNLVVADMSAEKERSDNYIQTNLI